MFTPGILSHHDGKKFAPGWKNMLEGIIIWCLSSSIVSSSSCGAVFGGALASFLSFQGLPACPTIPLGCCQRPALGVWFKFLTLPDKIRAFLFLPFRVDIIFLDVTHPKMDRRT
jgi:hypothetical protein